MLDEPVTAIATPNVRTVPPETPVEEVERESERASLADYITGDRG